MPGVFTINDITITEELTEKEMQKEIIKNIINLMKKIKNYVAHQEGIELTFCKNNKDFSIVIIKYFDDTIEIKVKEDHNILGNLFFNNKLNLLKNKTCFKDKIFLKKLLKELSEIKL